MKQKSTYQQPQTIIVNMSCVHMLSQSQSGRTIEVEDYEDYIDDQGVTHHREDLWGNPSDAD